MLILQLWLKKFRLTNKIDAQEDLTNYDAVNAKHVLKIQFLKWILFWKLFWIEKKIRKIFIKLYIEERFKVIWEIILQKKSNSTKMQKKSHLCKHLSFDLFWLKIMSLLHNFRFEISQTFIYHEERCHKDDFFFFGIISCFRQIRCPIKPIRLFYSMIFKFGAQKNYLILSWMIKMYDESSKIHLMDNWNIVLVTK